jgi:hypothetical protein
MDCHAALAMTIPHVRHCEECSDVAIHGFMDCHAALAMTIPHVRHCEERSDAAIHGFMDCHAALAMTDKSWIATLRSQ